MNIEVQPCRREAAQALGFLQVDSGCGFPGFSWFSGSGHIQNIIEVGVLGKILAGREGQMNQRGADCCDRCLRRLCS